MNPILPFTALARVLRRTGFVLLLALSAGSCTTNDVFPDTATGNPGDDTATDDATLIRFDIAPRPGFTDRPSTRIAQTTDAAQWEEGDILWVRADFYDNTDQHKFTYISALKYAGRQWRPFTIAESQKDYLLRGSRLFTYYSRILRWPDTLLKEPGSYCKLRAVYLGNMEPDIDNGIVDINPIQVYLIETSDGNGGAYTKVSPGATARLQFRHCNTRLRFTSSCIGSATLSSSVKYSLVYFTCEMTNPTFSQFKISISPGGEDFRFLHSDDVKNDSRIDISNGTKINGFILLPDANGEYAGMSYTIDPDALLPSGPIAPEF